MTRLSPIFIALLIASCGAENKSRTSANAEDAGQDAATADVGADATATLDSGPDADPVVTLPSLCNAGSSWANGLTAFRDASADWGLDAINAEGVRISAVDFDGDGWLDVFARKTGINGDKFEEGVRTTWLLRNTGDGKFEDVTRASGLVRGKFAIDDTIGRPSDVTVFGDIDNDGDMDAFVGFSNDGTITEGAAIMINNGDGTFGQTGATLDFQRDLTKEAIGGAAFADLNRDGRLDLWIGYGAVDGAPQQDRAYLQQADGSFKDATAELGLTSRPWSSLADINAGRAHTNAWSAAACDLNNDGLPDLLAASYGRAPNHLWLSGSNGYENASVRSGYAFDENQDWSDNISAQCYCSANRSAAGCATVPEPTGINCSSTRGWNPTNDVQAFRLGGNSGTTACGDLNNDGALDLLTTEIVHWDVGANSDPSSVLYNNGDGTFTRPLSQDIGLTRTHEPGWNDGDITAAILDFDNDGRNDIFIASTDYPGTRALLYWQKPDGTFQLVPPAQGIQHPSAHGVVTGDFDNDGDLDIIVGHSANRCSSGTHCLPAGERHIRLFENVVGDKGNAVRIHLVGASSNRAAIGARVTAAFGDATQVHEVEGGHGHYGLQNDAVVHVGLGTSCEALTTVRWPNANGAEQTATLQAGYVYRWVEGESPTVIEK
ncbi:MAG: CRTAC1 family protein [bacterium]